MRRRDDDVNKSATLDAYEATNEGEGTSSRSSVSTKRTKVRERVKKKL